MAMPDDPSDEQAKAAIEAQPPLCVDCKYVTAHDTGLPGKYTYTCSKCMVNKRNVVDGSLDHFEMACWAARGAGDCRNEGRLFEPKDSVQAGQ